MMTLLDANSGSILPNPQVDYIIFSKTVFSQVETKKTIKSNQPQSGIKIKKPDNTCEIPNMESDAH